MILNIKILPSHWKTLNLCLLSLLSLLLSFRHFILLNLYLLLMKFSIFLAWCIFGLSDKVVYHLIVIVVEMLYSLKLFLDYSLMLGFVVSWFISVVMRLFLIGNSLFLWVVSFLGLKIKLFSSIVYSIVFNHFSNYLSHIFLIS
jgi:hypothetical protein